MRAEAAPLSVERRVGIETRVKEGLSRILALTLLFFKPALRQPVVTLVVVLIPVGFILIFRIVGGASLSMHALYGTLVVFATNVGLVSLPQLSVSHRARRTLDMFVASPVGPGSYAIGLGLSRLVWVAPGLVMVLVVLLVWGGLPATTLPVIVGVLVCTWLTGVAIGFTVATLVQDLFLVSQVANLGGLLVSVIPPVYYPLSMIPEGWRWLPMLLPTTNAAELIRVAGGVSETSGLMIALHWAILVAYAAGCTFVVARKWRWEER